MTRYVLRRLLEAALVLAATLTIAFFLVRLSGDPTHIILPLTATAEDRALLQHKLGLDRPLVVQYADFVRQALRGHFGKSYFEDRSVREVILDALPATVQLTVVATLLSLLVAIPLGTAGAVHRGRGLDRLGQVLSLTGYSMPSFWSGILLIQLFSVVLGWFPTFGTGTLRHLVLPAANLTLYGSARLSRLTRSAVVEVLNEDYVRTARAKGLGERTVIYRHALRNALLPVVTLLGVELGVMLGGAVLTESVFAWPGIGWLVIRSITRRDYPVVQGIVGYVAVIFTGLNLVVDLAYTYINPKVRYT